MRRLTILLVAAGLAAFSFLGCGEGESTSTATTTTPTTGGPGQVAPPAGGIGAVPPEVTECLAERGYEVESPEDMHSAPPDALQACFGH